MKPFSLRTNKILKQSIVIGIWVLIWQGLYIIVGKDILVPSPFNTFKAFTGLIKELDFYIHILFTLYRVVMGSVISFLLGILTAIISYYSLAFREFLKPFIVILKSTPVMGIIIIALLWFNANQMPIFVCFLMCYPVVYSNVLAGFLSVDNGLLEMSKVYKVKRQYVIKDIYLPHTMPYIKSATSLIVGLAFKVVIAAEVLAVPKYSMGYHLLNAKVFLETSELFAWLMVIVFLSSICEKGVIQLLNYKRSKAQ